MIEPLLGRREVILFLQLFERRIVEGPHALVGAGRNAGQKRAARHQGGQGPERVKSIH